VRSPSTYLINFPLDYQPPAASGNELFKNLLKVFRNLFKRSFDRFILALIQNLDKFLDRLCGFIKVFATLNQLIPLFCEVIVLLESLLVDVCELLEAVVDFLQLLDQLRRAISSVLATHIKKRTDTLSRFS